MVVARAKEGVVHRQLFEAGDDDSLARRWYEHRRLEHRLPLRLADVLDGTIELEPRVVARASVVMQELIDTVPMRTPLLTLIAQLSILGHSLGRDVDPGCAQLRVLPGTLLLPLGCKTLVHCSLRLLLLLDLPLLHLLTVEVGIVEGTLLLQVEVRLVPDA
ncbi:hypothetical protein B5M09_013449 [Aphanomyces astaci]|uniref:Uncharacterized protein n=1 Tax=Aphanomyces astaci TaxID=112090 RepID=A0A425DNB1_APHAT|nr:hypothetical protein B5M09_013449 [Aphanomyces astaci]